jgi:Tn3 transposase DDE domain
VARLERVLSCAGKSRSRAGGGAAEDRQLHGLYALYKIDQSRHYAQLDAILDGTIKPHLVRRAWDETVRVMASIPTASPCLSPRCSEQVCS